MKKVIVYGSETLCCLLFHDALDNPDFQIAGFAMDQEYLTGPELMGLPLVSFQDLPSLYPAAKFDLLALFNGYSSMRDREKMYLRAKHSGYTLRNYISSRADAAADITMGDNNVIMGSSHLGFAGVMGCNNLIRQHVYLGHQFNLGSHNIITAGCTIGGHGVIKDSCYIGLGVTIIDHVRIEDENLIGAGSVVIKNTEPFAKCVGNPSRIIGYHREKGIRMRTSRH